MSRVGLWRSLMHTHSILEHQHSKTQVREPHIGKIIDFRDHSKSPCFDNLIRYESEKLKELAKEAIEAQIVILEADTADHSKLLKNLRAEMKDILKVSSNKSDKQWKKDGW